MSDNEYKYVWLNGKCLRDLMGRIKRKDHKVVTYEINKVSLPCFHDKILIQNNG